MEAAYAIKHPPPIMEGYEEERVSLLRLKNEELSAHTNDENLKEKIEKAAETHLNNIIKKEDHLWRLWFEESFALKYTELIVSNKLLRDYMVGEVKPIPNENLYNLFQEIIDSKIKEAEVKEKSKKLTSILIVSYLEDSKRD